MRSFGLKAEPVLALFAWLAASACSRNNGHGPPGESGSSANDTRRDEDRVADGGGRGARAAPAAAGVANGDEGAILDAPRTAPVFVPPIAATRLAGTTIVAGLAPAANAVRVVGFAPTGASWTRDVFPAPQVAPPDAELELEPVGDAVAAVWRTTRAEASSSKLAVLGPAGQIIAPARDIAGSWCATSDGVAWIAPHAHAPAHVSWWARAGGTTREVAVVPADRTPSMVCGDHDLFVLGDGDDDVTMSRFVPGTESATPPASVLRRADFPDEEAEHRAFTIGDDLRMVRIAESGAVSVRSVSTPVGLWRKLKHRLEDDDDVVAIDGDDVTTFIVFTRPPGDECPGMASSPEAVHALRVEATGAESMLDLAPAECTVAAGPFWLDVPPRRPPTLAWAEEAASIAPGAFAVRDLAFRRLSGSGPTGRVAVTTDVLVDAGCDGARCFAAFLLRAPAQDASQAASIALLDYP